MNTVITFRTNSAIKKLAQSKVKDFGLDLTSALNMYLNDLVAGRTSLSSDTRYVKNEVMEKWEKERKQAIKKGKKFSTVKELMKDLEN